MNRKHASILLAACLLAGTAGYLRGSHTAGAAPEAVGLPTKSASSTRGHSGPLTPAGAQALLREIVRKGSEAPGGSHDVRACDEISAILGRLGADDLRALAAELESQLRSEVAVQGQELAIKALARAWSRLEPEAAATAFAENPYTFSFRSEAFHDWLRRDPDAVAAWLATAPSDAAHDRCRIWHLTDRAIADPARLVPDLGGLGDKPRRELLLDWSVKFGGMPGSWPALESLIAREANPDLALRCYQRVGFLFSRAQPGERQALLMRAQVRESDRGELAGTFCRNGIVPFIDGDLPQDERAAVRGIYEVWHHAEPQAAEAWLLERPEEERWIYRQ